MNKQISPTSLGKARKCINNLPMEIWVSLENIPEDIRGAAITMIVEGSHLHNISFDETYTLIKKQLKSNFKGYKHDRQPKRKNS
jgi:hypothetical protein